MGPRKHAAILFNCEIFLFKLIYQVVLWLAAVGFLSEVFIDPGELVTLIILW
jgi:hypothetical protein